MIDIWLLNGSRELIEPEYYNNSTPKNDVKSNTITCEVRLIKERIIE